MAQSKVTLLIETKLEKFEELQRAGEAMQKALGVGKIAAEYQALDTALGSILTKIKAINKESGKSGVLGVGGNQPIDAAHGGAGSATQAKSAVAEQIAATGPVPTHVLSGGPPTGPQGMGAKDFRTVRTGPHSYEYHAAAAQPAARTGFTRVNQGFSMGDDRYAAPETRRIPQFPAGTIVPDRLLPPGHPGTPVPRPGGFVPGGPILDPADEFLGYHPSVVAQSTVAQQIEKAAPEAKAMRGATGRWAVGAAPLSYLRGAAPSIGAKAAFPVTPKPPDVPRPGIGAGMAIGAVYHKAEFDPQQAMDAERLLNWSPRIHAARANEKDKAEKLKARLLERQELATQRMMDKIEFTEQMPLPGPGAQREQVGVFGRRPPWRGPRPMTRPLPPGWERAQEQLARRGRLFGAVGGLGIPGVSPWAQRQAAPPRGGGGGAGGAGGEGGDMGALGALGAIPAQYVTAAGVVAGLGYAAKIGWDYYSGRRLGTLGGVGGAQQLAASHYQGKWALYGGMAGGAAGGAAGAKLGFLGGGPKGAAAGALLGMGLGAMTGRAYGTYVGGVAQQVAQTGTLGREFQTGAQELALTGAGGGGIGGLIGSGEYFQPPQTSPGATGIRPDSQALGYTINQQMAMGVQTFGAAWAAPRELDNRRQKTIMQMTRFGVAPKVTGQMLFNLSRSAKTIRMTGPHGTVSQGSTAWGRGGRDWLTPTVQGLFTEGLGFEEQRQMYGMAGRMMGEGFLRTGIQGGVTMGNIQQFVGGGTGPGGQGPSLAQQGGGTRALQFAEGMVGYGRGLARTGPQSPFDFALISTLTGGGGVSPQSLADAYKALETGDVLDPTTTAGKRYRKFIGGLQNYGGDPAFGEMMVQKALSPVFGGQLGLGGAKKIGEMIVQGRGADVTRKEWRRIQAAEGLGGLAGGMVTPEMKDTARIQDEMTGIGNEMIKTMIIFEEAAKDMTIQLKKLGPEIAQLARQMSTASGGN